MGPFCLSELGLGKRKKNNLFLLQPNDYRGLPLAPAFRTPTHQIGKDTIPSSFIIYSFLYVRVYLGLVVSQGWVGRSIKTWQPSFPISGCRRAPASRPQLKNVLFISLPRSLMCSSSLPPASITTASISPERFPLPPFQGHWS